MQAVWSAFSLEFGGGFPGSCAGLGGGSAAAAPVPQPTGLFLLVIVPLLTAFGGWACGCILQSNPELFPGRFCAFALGEEHLCTLLNKLYIDEIYGTFLVRPTIRFASWLWREIDVLWIDRLINGIATFSLLVARWLWHVVDVRGLIVLWLKVVTRALAWRVGCGRLSMCESLIVLWLKVVTRALAWRVGCGRLSMCASLTAVRKKPGKSLSLSRVALAAVDVRRIEKSSDRVGAGRRLTGHGCRTSNHERCSTTCWF